VGKGLLQNFKNPSVFVLAKNEMDYINKNNISCCSYLEENYPDRLKYCIDGPVLLFSAGAINWNNKKIISIVGTRQVSAHGIDFCKKLIQDLAPLNPIIVSGFAYGVDIVAHQAALENNLQTVAVLAHGLNQIYPKSHKKYVSKMEQNGGFLTEFWSTSSPEKENFVKRNRIVAGISEATIVIESAEKGGSLITALLANDYNRDVFAVPGRTTDKFSQGCNNLIKTQRAHLLTSAADLIYILNWEIHNQEKQSIQKQLFVSLNEIEQKIYDYLLAQGKTEIDQIALECDYPVFKTSSVLVNMELKGVIRPLPGKLFEAI
jgi:DNA processing protein